MRTSRLLAAVTAALLVVACAPGGPAAPPPDGATPSAAVDEGYVVGAEETAEAQWRLVVADAGSGAVRVLDLTTEEVVDAGTVPAAGPVRGDGRFGYVVGDGGVHIVDIGAWMVDHGDHVHYYRAPARTVGLLPGPAPTSVHSDAAVTAVSHVDGTVTLLDRARLDAGEVVETARVPRAPHRGTAVPHQEHVLVSAARPGQDRADAVEVWTRAGHRFAAIDVACPHLEGQAVTRRGVVFGPTPYGRIGNQAGSDASPITLGDYKQDEDAELERPTRISLIDTATKELTLLDIGTSYTFRSLARGPRARGWCSARTVRST